MKRKTPTLSQHRTKQKRKLYLAAKPRKGRRESKNFEIVSTFSFLELSVQKDEIPKIFPQTCGNSCCFLRWIVSRENGDRGIAIKQCQLNWRPGSCGVASKVVFTLQSKRFRLFFLGLQVLNVDGFDTSHPSINYCRNRLPIVNYWG